MFTVRAEAPQSASANQKVPYPYRVVLHRISTVRQSVEKPLIRLPPIIVIAAKNDFFAGKSGYFVYIGESLFKAHSPRYVACDQYDVLFPYLAFPIFAYVIPIAVPTVAEYVHRLIAATTEMQIAHGKYFHTDIISRKTPDNQAISSLITKNRETKRRKS